LNLVPFGALVDEQDRYLVESFTFNYLASGRDLLRSEEGSKARGKAIVIANPAFDSGGADIGAGAKDAASPVSARSRDFSGLKFEALPGTAAEAQALQHIVPEALVLTGEQATETALKRLHGPRILHIATHGFFLEDQVVEPVKSGRSRAAPVREDPMLRSGLAFAGANRPASGDDDGVLTALEAAGLDLVGTKLVVLSACETGFGEVKNGEGVFGLRRAFAVAGAETMLMSLWQVEDEAPKNLMVEYHRRLVQGEDRTEALRQAQVALLRDPKHSHPFFWASFISSGQVGALK
jgi:CHAT domain-containing protein